MCAVEKARSLAAAAEHQRTDIELPGALRFLSRLCRAIHSALRIVRGLDPDTFLIAEPSVAGFTRVLGTDSVLNTLRDRYARYLPQLPTPLGFNPSRANPVNLSMSFQHRMGRDPPHATIEPAL